MKKHVFLCIPKDIKSGDYEKLRDHYENQGFAVWDPYQTWEDLNNMRVENSDFDFDDKKFRACMLLDLSMCDAMILASGWKGHEDCNLFIHFSLMNDIPIYEQFTNNLLSFKSGIKIKITGRQKDDYILDSSKADIYESEINTL